MNPTTVLPEHTERQLETCSSADRILVAQSARAASRLGRVSVGFTEANLVPNAGLLPAVMLAQRVDLPGLFDDRLRLAVHGASSGIRALTVIGSILAGGDSIVTSRSCALVPLAGCSMAPGPPRRSGRGCGRTSRPTCASTTPSAVSCLPGSGPRAPAQQT